MTDPGRRRLFGLPVCVSGIVSIPVRFRRVIPVRHVGVITDAIGADGQPTILHSSERRGGVVETTASEFIAHRAGQLLYHGRLGSLSSDEMLARGRAAVGTPYDAMRNNCEHFALRAAGEEPTSPQLRAGTTAATFATGVAASIVGSVIWALL